MITYEEFINGIYEKKKGDIHSKSAYPFNELSNFAVHSLLSQFDPYDSEDIRRVLSLIKCGDNISIAAIQHELKIGYMRASKIMDSVIDAGILKRIDDPIPDSAGNKKHYEVVISENQLTELCALLHFEKQLKEFANDRNMIQTIQALEFIRQKRAWKKQKKEGFFNIPPLAMAHNAFVNMGIQDDDAISTILLQEMVEHHGVSLEELPVTDKVRSSIDVMTFYTINEETEEIAKKRYYDRLIEDREATLAILVDELHNFPQDRSEQYIENAKEYIKDVKKYVMPLIDKAKDMYPADSKAISYLEENITSVVSSMELIVRILERGFSRS